MLSILIIYFKPIYFRQFVILFLWVYILHWGVFMRATCWVEGFRKLVHKCSSSIRPTEILFLDEASARLSVYRKYFQDDYMSTVPRTLHGAWLFWRNCSFAADLQFQTFCLFSIFLYFVYFGTIISPCALVCQAEWKVCAVTAGLNQHPLSELTWGSVWRLCTPTKMTRMCTRRRILWELQQKRGVTTTKCSRIVQNLWSMHIF